MTEQAVSNSLAIVAAGSFVRIGLPIIVVFTILEAISTPRKEDVYLFVFILLPQALFVLFLITMNTRNGTPKVLVLREDGVLVATRKGGFPIFTPSKEFFVGYDRISKVYEGSLTTRPAFVLVDARVLLGNWEDRYLVTGRVAHLLHKNWEAHKLGHAVQLQ